MVVGHTDFLQDKKIILLESAPEKKDFKLTERYSNRTCAISPSTVGLFQSESAKSYIVALSFSDNYVLNFIALINTINTIMHLMILALLKSNEINFKITDIGAWDEILQMRCQPVKRMQVSVHKMNVCQW